MAEHTAMHSPLTDIVTSGMSVYSAPGTEGRTITLIDLDALQARTNRTAAEIARLKFAIIVPMFLAGLVLAAACIPQGIENWKATQIAGTEQ